MGPFKKDRLQGTLDLLILKTLASRGAAHGYAIASHIGRVSEALLTVEEGSLYPALHRLEQAGLIASEWRMSETNRRARFYQLRSAGRRRLAEEEQHWARLVEGVESVLKVV
ncbi:MAG TPA: PadR family transcriptional regulator [Terriglobales bacterium]|nr:PadR family transcriptional regulator [Terriglobales bacterium]